MPGLISPELTGFLDRSARLQIATGGLSSDTAQVEGSRVRYGDPTFDTLLADLGPRLGDRLGLDLIPTYSFLRGYSRDMALQAHTDRPACEISVTLHLGSDDRIPWPICAHGLDDVDVAVVLNPGDALAYRGCEVPHWRDRCPSRAYRQVFLHYVDAKGPYAAERFDRRPFLGAALPAVAGEGREQGPAWRHVAGS